MLAAGPRLAAPDDDQPCPDRGLARVLDDARTAHRLTVIDCGTPAGRAEQIALRAATHIAWLLPATQSAAARGARVLDAIDPQHLGRQLLVARRDPSEPKAPLAELKTLAARRQAPLILLPHLRDLRHDRPAAALDAAQVPLQAIVDAVTR